MELLKTLGISENSVRLAYLMGRDTGRKFLKGCLILPGMRISDLQKLATRNKDDAGELIEKRDRMLDGIIDFVEELINLDND